MAFSNKVTQPTCDMGRGRHHIPRPPQPLVGHSTRDKMLESKFVYYSILADSQGSPPKPPPPPPPTAPVCLSAPGCTPPKGLVDTAADLFSPAAAGAAVPRRQHAGGRQPRDRPGAGAPVLPHAALGTGRPRGLS